MKRRIQNGSRLPRIGGYYVLGQNLPASASVAVGAWSVSLRAPMAATVVAPAWIAEE